MKSTIIVLCIGLFTAWPLHAAVPSFVTYSGRLTDGTGWGESTEVDLTFRLYDWIDAPTPMWTTTHLNVVVVDGYFTVNLGMCNEDGTSCVVNPAQAQFPKDLPDHLWVAVVVQGVELERQAIGSVPYAVSAWNGTPAGMIGMFEAACPAGWEEVAGMADRFPRAIGASGFFNNPRDGGSNTHTHGSPPHDHYMHHHHRVQETGYCGDGGCWPAPNSPTWNTKLYASDAVDDIQPPYNSRAWTDATTVTVNSSGNIPAFRTFVFCRFKGE